MGRLHDSARKMFDGKNFAFLATLNPDGSPQVTPMWADTDGEYILLNTAIGRVKQRNAKNDPRVAVALVDQTNPYSMVAVQGRVVEQLTGRVADDHIDKLAKKYTGADRYGHRQPGEQRVILKVAPKRVTKWR